MAVSPDLLPSPPNGPIQSLFFLVLKVLGHRSFLPKPLFLLVCSRSGVYLSVFRIGLFPSHPQDFCPKSLAYFLACVIGSYLQFLLFPTMGNCNPPPPPPVAVVSPRLFQYLGGNWAFFPPVPSWVPMSFERIHNSSVEPHISEHTPFWYSVYSSNSSRISFFSRPHPVLVFPNVLFPSLEFPFVRVFLPQQRTAGLPPSLSDLLRNVSFFFNSRRFSHTQVLVLKLASIYPFWSPFFFSNATPPTGVAVRP